MLQLAHNYPANSMFFFLSLSHQVSYECQCSLNTLELIFHPRAPSLNLPRPISCLQPHSSTQHPFSSALFVQSPDVNVSYECEDIPVGRWQENGKRISESSPNNIQATRHDDSFNEAVQVGFNFILYELLFLYWWVFKMELICAYLKWHACSPLQCTSQSLAGCQHSYFCHLPMEIFQELPCFPSVFLPFTLCYLSIQYWAVKYAGNILWFISSELWFYRFRSLVYLWGWLCVCDNTTK